MSTASPLSLDEWAEAQLHISAAKMAESVSATSLVKHRPGFGQTVRPTRGSVLAAPGVGESEPDYFFHWLRDSAAIMDAALILILRGIDAEGWKQRFADFVRFSLDLSRISGRRFLAETDMRSRTAPDMQQFLRPDEDIAAVEGEKLLGEVRYNADGTLDFLRWNRPQYDGPAFRALACLRYLDAGAVADDAQGMRGRVDPAGPPLYGGACRRALLRPLGGRDRPPLLYLPRTIRRSAEGRALGESQRPRRLCGAARRGGSAIAGDA